jgi:hypothetical protein
VAEWLVAEWGDIAVVVVCGALYLAGPRGGHSRFVCMAFGDSISTWAGMYGALPWQDWGQPWGNHLLQHVLDSQEKHAVLSKRAGKRRA